MEKAQELAPDIILMDLAMPIMGGLEAIRRISKEMPETIKVLVLTQYDDCEYVIPAIQSGARGFVNKMAAFSELANAIHVVSRGDSYLSPTAAATLIEEYQHKDIGEEEYDPYNQLTDREKEVLKLVVEGYTAREIADILFISPKTVEWHKTSMMNKLNIRNKVDLIKFALRRSIINL